VTKLLLSIEYITKHEFAVGDQEKDVVKPRNRQIHELNPKLLIAVRSLLDDILSRVYNTTAVSNCCYILLSSH